MKQKKMEINAEIESQNKTIFPHEVRKVSNHGTRKLKVHKDPDVTGNRSISEWSDLSLGAVLVIIGLVGFAAPELAGMHLNPVLNGIYIALGAIALWVGIDTKASTGRVLGYAYGAVFSLTAIAGYVFGVSAISTTPYAANDRFLWSVIPGNLELGANDHLFELIMGALFLVTTVTCQIAAKKAEEKQIHSPRAA